MLLIEPKHIDWKDRRVIVKVNLAKPNSNGEKIIEIDGILEMVHINGIMVKPIGRIQREMLAPPQIESIDLYDEVPQPIEQKEMRDVPFGQIRKHLADRHAFSITELNAAGYTEASAYDDHLQDHKDNGDDLSHRHEDS